MVHCLAGLSARTARRVVGLSYFSGVGAIAAVGNVSESVLSALERDGRKLLGGDVELRLTHQEATPDQIDWLRANTERVAELATMRTTAYGPDQRRLVELKAVDEVYPLFGEMALADGIAFDGALDKKDGVWGAVTEAGLLERLNITVGDTVALGDIDVQIRGVIATERPTPDDVDGRIDGNRAGAARQPDPLLLRFGYQ